MGEGKENAAQRQLVDTALAPKIDAQELEPATQPPPHCVDGDAVALRDLFRLESLEEAEENRPPVRLLQTPHGAKHTLAQLGAFEESGIAWHFFVLSDLRFTIPAPTVGPELPCGDTTRHGGEPGTRRGPLRHGPGQGRSGRVLDKILGPVRVADEGACEAPKPVEVGGREVGDSHGLRWKSSRGPALREPNSNHFYSRLLSYGSTAPWA